MGVHHHSPHFSTATPTTTTTIDSGDPPPQPPLTTTVNPTLRPPAKVPLPSSSDYQSKPHLNGSKLTKKNKKRAPDDTASSSSSSSIICSHNHNLSSSHYRGIRIFNKRRNPRFSVRRSATDVETIAFPLGMSIAAVLAQVLERKDLTTKTTSVDHLSEIFSSAVRESLINVFGDKCDAFARNFEKSFGSTLSTLRLIKNSSLDNGEAQEGHSNFHHRPFDTTPTICSNKGELSSRNCDITFETRENFKIVEEVEDNDRRDYKSQELSLPRNMSHQLDFTLSNTGNCLSNHSMFNTIEKSVVEQTRANDLKSVEIGLIMKKLQLKETELALNSDSNFLERCKLSLGISRTSFKAEKFKNQLEETRHSELLKLCADFLVADLLIMSSCLAYGVYAFSYDKLHQLTKSCSPSVEAKSWWVPRPMASFNSGLQTINCQVQVYSRMLFGILMILAIAYVLIQRSAISRQAMPITFIILLLGVGCGFAGKLCVDTLGGDGNHWLIYWEVLCFLHFFANVFTSLLFYILNGAIQVSQGTKNSSIFPYWIRRWLFYLTLLLVPVSCGLLPFASPRKWWEEHFSHLIKNHLLASYGDNYDHESGLHG